MFECVGLNLIQSLDYLLASYTVMQEMSYQHYDNIGYSYPYNNKEPDMASYVLLQGLPNKDTCKIYGLTPKETLYVKVGEFELYQTLELDQFLAVKVQK